MTLGAGGGGHVQGRAWGETRRNYGPGRTLRARVGHRLFLLTCGSFESYGRCGNLKRTSGPGQIGDMDQKLGLGRHRGWEGAGGLCRG